MFCYQMKRIKLKDGAILTWFSYFQRAQSPGWKLAAHQSSLGRREALSRGSQDQHGRDAAYNLRWISARYSGRSWSRRVSYIFVDLFSLTWWNKKMLSFYEFTWIIWSTRRQSKNKRPSSGKRVKRKSKKKTRIEQNIFWENI